MKCALLAVMLILVSESTQNEAELTQSTLPNVPQWYIPCLNSREGRSKNQRFIKITLVSLEVSHSPLTEASKRI